MRMLLNASIKVFKSNLILQLILKKVFTLIIQACSLAELNRFTEAINCLEEGLEYFPFHPLFITLLDSYKLKLK